MTRERFIELVGEVQEPLRRFLLALCLGDRQEAEDIAQDTLVKAYVASASYTERHKFSSWLFKIAYNTFLDRKRRGNVFEGSLESREALAVCSNNKADRAFEYESLYKALAQLPMRERTALLLFYIGGCSVKEAAAIMDCNAGALKVLLSRGRQKLKEKLENGEK